MYQNQYENTSFGYGGAIYFGLFGIWNLDFFKLLYTPFCLNPNATTLQVLSLDYIIVVYPLLLIILTYTLVRLHYNNCRLVVWMWRPFLSCFAHCRKQWDIQNSLVDAFATFFLLSYVKFFSVSIDILTPADVWDSIQCCITMVQLVESTSPLLYWQFVFWSCSHFYQYLFSLYIICTLVGASRDVWIDVI